PRRPAERPLVLLIHALGISLQQSGRRSASKPPRLSRVCISKACSFSSPSACFYANPPGLLLHGHAVHRNDTPCMSLGPALRVRLPDGVKTLAMSSSSLLWQSQDGSLLARSLFRRAVRVSNGTNGRQ